jgi:phage gp29-like protein
MSASMVSINGRRRDSLGRFVSANARDGENGNRPLPRAITPSVRDRYLSTLGTKVAPASVVQILDAAKGGDLLQQSHLYQRMEETWPRLAKNMHELRQAVARAPYTVVAHAERGEDPSPKAEEKADFIQGILDDWRGDPIRNENNFEDCIYDICDAIGKGISIQEILYQQTDAGIGVSGTYWIDPSYYGYSSESPDLMLRPQSQNDWIDIPRDQFIVAMSKNRSGNPIGYGLMRPLAWLWSGMVYGRDWMLNYAQLFGVPIRWATYDPNHRDIESTLADMLEGMGSAGWGAFPKGTEINLVSPSSQGDNNPQERLIELADRTCDIAILGQSLTTDVGSSGSRALGDVHQGIRRERIENLSTWVACLLTESIVHPLIQLNYGNTEELPEFSVEISDASDPKADAERDAILLDTGIEVPKKWFYDRHNIPIPDGEEETLTKPKAPTPPAFGGPPPAQPEEEEPETPEQAEAREAQASIDALLDNVLEDVTAVAAQWLGPVRNVFTGLARKAASGRVTDNDFIMALEEARDLMPSLFDQVDTQALQDAMTKAMGAGMVNGAVDRGVAK